MTSYKELLMSRDAFLALRVRIDTVLTGDTIGPPCTIEVDESTGDLLITSTYAGVERTHQLVIKEVPTEGETPCS